MREKLEKQIKVENRKQKVKSRKWEVESRKQK